MVVSRPCPNFSPPSTPSCRSTAAAASWTAAQRRATQGVPRAVGLREVWAGVSPREWLDVRGPLSGAASFPVTYSEELPSLDCLSTRSLTAVTLAARPRRACAVSAR